LDEAQTNCLVAILHREGVGPRAGRLFRTRALRFALDAEALEARAHGELPALRAEARWLAGLHPNSDPGPRSWGDVALLLGAIHDYLERATRAEGHPVQHPHTIPAHRYPPASLRAYRGCDFGDLLGLWD
jgi:hypothetical protein